MSPRFPARHRLLTVLVAAATVLAGCGPEARMPPIFGDGDEVTMPPPETSLIPTVHIAPARGWNAGQTPQPGPGLSVQAFARDLDHPRWVYVLPNGDVLVAETNAPERPDARAGIKGSVMEYVMKKAGAGVPSADRITLLRDADGDGLAEQRSVFLDDLHSPFGMALVDDHFYVANTDALLRFPYTEGDTGITASGEQVAELPGGALNHHWTKNLIASADGDTLYVAVGSNSNVGENGMDREADRAAILEIDAATGTRRVFAFGLRNPVGMAWHTPSGSLWTVVNERDELGGDLVPDYLTEVHEGAFYGWPYSYFGDHVDTRVEPPRPDLVETARVPDYALGAHTASLGLAYAPPTPEDGEGSVLSERFADGMFVGQHGSWNRKPRSGYKVIYVPFQDGRPNGEPQDVLDGFLNPQGEALGRPVGVALDRDGALLVADDVGNTIWRVTARPPVTPTAAATDGAAPSPP